MPHWTDEIPKADNRRPLTQAELRAVESSKRAEPETVGRFLLGALGMMLAALAAAYFGRGDGSGGNR